MASLLVADNRILRLEKKIEGMRETMTRQRKRADQRLHRAERAEAQLARHREARADNEEGIKLAQRILHGSYRPEPADGRLDALTLARVVAALSESGEGT